MYYLRATMTLNLISNLVSEQSCPEHISCITWEIEYQIWYVGASWDDEVSHTIFWSL